MPTKKASCLSVGNSFSGRTACTLLINLITSNFGFIHCDCTCVYQRRLIKVSIEKNACPILIVSRENFKIAVSLIININRFITCARVSSSFCISSLKYLFSPSMGSATPHLITVSMTRLIISARFCKKIIFQNQ